MFTVPSIDELFEGVANTRDRVKHFEQFKDALGKAQSDSRGAWKRGEIQWTGREIVKRESVQTQLAHVIDTLSKSLDASQISAINAALEPMRGDINKAGSDWTLTNPLDDSTSGVTGLVPYNLDPALSMLIPRSFILRQRTPRVPGIGQSTEFRRIIGLSNAGVGGVGRLSTFFNPTGTTATFGPLTLNRPSKITYAADKVVLSMVNQGVSDEVDMTAQYAGMGYVDLSQVSHTAAMWAHLLGEEQNMANGRSTVLDVTGVTFTAAPSSTVTAGSGLPTIDTGAPPVGNVYISFNSSMGESQAIGPVAVSADITAGHGIDITLTGDPVPSGSVSINVYVVSTGPDYWVGTAIAVGSSTPDLIVSPTTFAAIAALPSTAEDNGSGSSLAYDGYTSVLTNPALAGYVNALNGALSSTPGEDFQTAFYAMYSNGYLASPNVIFATAGIAQFLGTQIFAQGSPTSYRANFDTEGDGVTIGSYIKRIINSTTQRPVDLIVHPYLAPGVALIHSDTLPFPDSGVSNTVDCMNVQDLLVLDWPVIQLSRDLSTYQYGTLRFKAPKWSGALTNVTSV
jgi:hypothetical protein